MDDYFGIRRTRQPRLYAGSGCVSEVQWKQLYGTLAVSLMMMMTTMMMILVLVHAVPTRRSKIYPPVAP